MLQNLNFQFQHIQQLISQIDDSEYKLSLTFQQHLKNALSAYEVKFNEKTTLFISRDMQKQFCPNQWLRLVEYGIDYYDELLKYKQCYLEIRENLISHSPTLSRKMVDELVKELRGKKFEQIPAELDNEIDHHFNSPDQAILFRRFLVDYTWWHGEKTIDRNDFFNTPLLNLYDVIHVDNGFLLKLTKALADYSQLLGKQILFKDALTEHKTEGPFLAPIIDNKFNLIYFGAPGTGKSKALDIKREAHFKQENYERVTFYPNYSYGQFFGTYKPKKIIQAGSSELTYEFVPGPLFRLLIKAFSNPQENYLLIIEEINRANAAAVFGDVFQLLDRDKYGVSEYPIHLSEDALAYIEEYYPTLSFANGELKLPSNLYIWATMNSADQGVQPLDSAFKRRFDFEFMTINTNESLISTYMISIPGVDYEVNWNVFRKLLNVFLLNNYRHIKEDKLIGPFFIKPATLESADFMETFKNKLLMYLSEDILKTADKSKLFSIQTYSELMDLCSNNAAKIFTKEFYDLLDLEMSSYNSALSADLSDLEPYHNTLSELTKEQGE